jgi:hypothetical protein
MNGYTLSQTQNWIQTVLTKRGCLAEKIQQARDVDGIEIEQLIKERRNISRHQRLDVYAAGYVLRLVDCLKSEFALLAEFMGDETFELFAKAYIVTKTSQSWSLFYLGEQFADFLADTQPQAPQDPHMQVMFSIPAQLAKFERTKAEVLAAHGIEMNRPDLLNEMAGLFAMLQGETQIQTAPCLVLLELDYPLLALVEQLEQKQSLELPQSQTTLLAMTRINYCFKAFNLSRWQYCFLSHCKQPISIKGAIKKTADALSISSDQLRGDIQLWLPLAISNAQLVYR